MPIAEQSATVGNSVLAVAVLAKRTGRPCELNLHEEGSRRQVQGKLGEVCVEVAVVVFNLQVSLFTKQGIEIGESILRFLILETVVNL